MLGGPREPVMNKTRSFFIPSLMPLTVVAIGACDASPAVVPKVDDPKEAPQLDVPEPGACQGMVAVANGELTLTRTAGPPNAASLVLPNLSSLCITLESDASSASVDLNDATLWPQSFFKNTKQADATVVSDLGGGPNTLSATIQGKPGSSLTVKAYYAHTPVDGSGPSTPDEALVIGEAFIKYNHDHFSMFSRWNGAHAVKVTEIADIEGTVAAYELRVVGEGGGDAGYLVLERDPLRPILGSAALEGPALTDQLAAAYEEQYGTSPSDAPSHRFLWAGAAIVALEVGDGKDTKRVENCPMCRATYSSADRPDVQRSKMGFSDVEWTVERQAKVKRMLDYLAGDEMKNTLPNTDESLSLLLDSPAPFPQNQFAVPSGDPTAAMLCPLGHSNEVPGGVDAFNRYWQVKTVKGVDECRWEEYGSDEKLCGWSGCVPIAVITLLDYWDRRYPFMLPYATKAGDELEMDNPDIVAAINEIRVAIRTKQLGWLSGYEALTLPLDVLGLDSYLNARANAETMATDAGWTVSHLPVSVDGKLNERLRVLRHEIDAGYPAILHFHADPNDEGWTTFALPDHGVVAIDYTDDGDAHEDNDMVGVLYGWSNRHYTENHIVPVSGIGLMAVTSVRPDCTGDVSAELCAQFADIPADHWGKTSAETLACRCVIRGYPDGRFHADDDVTKAEFLKMIIILAFGVNLDGDRVNSEGGQVCANHWASGYIDYAYKKGLLTDPLLTQGRFEPDQPISRQEAAYLVVEAGKASSLSKFKALWDKRKCFGASQTANPYNEDPGDPTVGVPYLEHVLAATSLCVFEGYQPSEDNPHQSFKPTKTISRIEAAKVACVARFGFGAPECEQNYDCTPLVTCDG